MPTSFPGSNDVFTEPDAPGTTPLNSPGTGTREHTEHHEDVGDAIEAMQAHEALFGHSHDGSTFRHGSKLAQANTHQSPDTDSGASSLHHTLGTGANQAASGTHTHTQANSHSSPDTDSATSALHHTIGIGANQAAAGNHVHGRSGYFFVAGVHTFEKGDYTNLYAIEVELVGGGGGSAGAAATDSTHWAFGLGGAGGGYARALILASNLSSVEVIIVGTGGAGGTGGANGTTGGTSSFGSHFSCTGGSPGTTHTQTISSTGSLFGSKSGGTPSGTYDIGVRARNTGSMGWGNTGSNFQVLADVSGFTGGRSGGPYGSETTSPRAAEESGFGTMSSVAGIGYGSGASGCCHDNSASARNGAAGSPGLCVIRLIF